MLKNPLLSLSDQGNGTAHGTNLSQGVINEQVTGIREGRDPLEHSGSPSGQNRSESSSISSTDQPSRQDAPNQPLLRVLFISFIYKAFTERQLKAVHWKKCKTLIKVSRKKKPSIRQIQPVFELLFLFFSPERKNQLNKEPRKTCISQSTIRQPSLCSTGTAAKELEKESRCKE